MLEYLRPWKLATLAVGTVLLLAGAGSAPDWGVPDSLLLAGFTYLTAPVAVRAARSWRTAPIALCLVWWGGFGVYALYWAVVDPRALAAMASAAVPVNVCLYLLGGLLWAPRGSLKSLAREAASALRQRPRLRRSSPA